MPAHSGPGDSADEREQVHVMNETLPYVSVVVPTYNRRALVLACLESLRRQDYPLDRYEIVLVDDGSTDGTAEAVAAAMAGWPGTFMLIRQANSGPAGARNTGIRASQGAIVAFTDSDCTVSPNWLAALVAGFTDERIAGVGGPIRNVAPRGWIAEYLTAAAFFRHRVRHGRVEYLLTASAAYRRDVLQNIGGFAERRGAWGEDADLSFRVAAQGYYLSLVYDNISNHHGIYSGVHRFAASLFRYGYGNSVLSRGWRNDRTPLSEFLRHGAALLLAPLFAARLGRRMGATRALTFGPLVVVEHAAFLAGLLKGVWDERLWGR